jgi:N-acetyl-anhydromuramyl-L-alanine amidase AmpD
MWWALLALQIKVIDKPISVRYKPLRDTTKNYIVLHYDESDNYFGTRRWLIKKGNSYHYYINRSGTIIKMMDPKYQAGHAGASFWRGNLRMNKYSIGICLENKPPQKYTLAQYNSLAWLIKVLQRRFDDPTSQVILGHSDVAVPRGRKKDPGPHFDWGELHRRLNQ